MKSSRRLLIFISFLTLALPSSWLVTPASALVVNLVPKGFYNNQYHSQPLSGPQRTLVILVEFTDVKHTQNKSAIDSLIFGQMATYYSDISYGQIQVVGKSVGWYTLPNSMAYYGEDINPEPGSDAHKLQLIKDAFDAVTDSVNFSEYSAFLIVHAGIGQEDSPRESSLIWSDAYYEELSILTKEGTIIHSVAIAPGMESGNHSALGVLTHEYGHLLSLPDLYDGSLRPGVPDDFVGRWSLMGTGLWLGNPNGTYPAELEAWSRIKLGWLVPDTLELTPANVSFYYETLHPLEQPAGVRAIEIPVSQTEYYLIELRNKTDSDRYLPSQGVLITKVDETKGTAEGIVQVIDANASSPTLNDATYRVGGIFNDTTQGLFIEILAGNPTTYSLLIGNQSPSSYSLTATEIAGAEIVNTTYSQPTIFSATLTDTSGNPPSGLPVRLQYYENGTWSDFGLAITDQSGNANFNESLLLKPGTYPIRYLFTGGKLDTQYLVGTIQPAVLGIRKVVTVVQLQAPEVIEATSTGTLTVRIIDEFGKPVDNVPLLVKADGQVIRRINVANGSASVPLSLGLNQLGEHTIRVEVQDSAIYVGSSDSAGLNVVTPPWFYGLIVLILILSLAAVYFARRMRKRPS